MNLQYPDWSDVRPGDCLGYFSEEFYAYIVAVKTFYKLSHVEIYEGNNHSLAARYGKKNGVNRYELRKSGIAVIRRPIGALDLNDGQHWFETRARGQGYDLLGQLAFFHAGHPSMCKMWCSEFATRYYRACHFQPFDPEFDADLVPPMFFMVSPMFETVWRNPRWEP